jgi:SRSO17 transposase
MLQDGLVMKEFFLDQQPVVGKLRDFRPLSFVKVDTKEKELLWNYMVKTWHYLGYQAIIGPRIKYLVLYQDKPLAAISFNQAALRIGVRDTWLGINHDNKLKILHHILNNNRFLILPWVRIKNLASHVLSKALKLLQADWPQIYKVVPYAVETCVDFSKYQGVCYKASNWTYMGETQGFGKIGKTFVYHGNRKGVFLYLLDRKLLQLISQFPARQPNPNLEHVRVFNMMLSIPDWSPDLFDEIGVNEESVTNLGSLLDEYLSIYSECYSRIDQQANGETYIKGLLSDLNRKSIEPIALRYLDEKAVRTMQLFLKDAPWNNQQMKKDYQHRVLINSNAPNGMITVDGSDFAKKGKKSAGIQRQYCGTKGKTDNCQAGVFIGYSGGGGYGLLDAQLYLPEVWFDDEHKALWSQCDIPEDTEFKTKLQIAIKMIQEAVENNGFTYKWVGCDAAFGCDSTFRANLPKSTFFFADLHSNQRVFPSRPQWSLPERKSKGKAPTKEVPSVAPIPVSAFALDNKIPWETITLMEGSKGPIITQVKYCRVIELQDGKDGEELWLYIRKYEDGTIKYSFTNAPKDIEIGELHHAATLRWPIEQSFQECKSYLGMSHYETRSYIGWQRHMLLVMVAHLFVVEVRFKFKKKKTTNLH